MKAVNERLPFLQADVEILQGELTSLSSRVFKLENSDRANNLITHKVPDNAETNDNLRQAVSAITLGWYKSLNVEGIVAISRLGKTEGNLLVLVRLQVRDLPSS